MKKLFLITLCVITAVMASAKNVSSDQALQMAEKFFRQNSRLHTSGTLTLVWNGETPTKSSHHEPAFYVFTNSYGGYVIISGENAVSPVLGYSRSGDFDKTRLPDNMRWWMEEIKNGINYLRDNNMEATATIRNQWNPDYGMPSLNSKGLLLETANWSQYTPYYDMCPIINGERALTGCVPTAMSIIMKYHKWPLYIDASSEAYEYQDDNGITQHIDGQRLDHSYNWDMMKMDYSGYYSSAEGNAVARLMADCGLLAKAKYGPTGTGTFSSDAATALVNHFGYDASAAYRTRDLYSQSDWISMLRTSLENYGPVYYDGSSNEGAHAFTVDGYDADGLFHINWGWGGYQNGYYLFPDFGDYKYLQGAIFNLQPDKGGIAPEIIGMEAYGNVNGLSFSGSDKVVPGVPFEITFGFLYNAGPNNFTGDFGVATVNKSEDIKEILYTWHKDDLKPGWGWTEFHVTCTVHMPIERGDKIKLFYKSAKGGGWMPVQYGDTGVVGELYLMDLLTLEESTSFAYHPEEHRIELSTKPKATCEILYQGSPVSRGTDYYAGELHIDTSMLEKGEYTIILTKDDERKELVFIL